MVHMSGDSLITVLTGVGVVVASAGVWLSFARSFRKDLTDMGGSLRKEISGLRMELKSDLRAVDGSLQRKISGLRTELKSDLKAVDGSLRQEIAEVRQEIAGLRTDMTAGDEASRQETVSLRASVQASEVAVRAEMSALRTGLTSEVREVGKRVDIASARIDRLADAGRVATSA